MKKPFAFAVAMLALPASCQLDRTGLVEGAAALAIDSGARRDTGTRGSDGGSARDTAIPPPDTATGDVGSAPGGSVGGASGTGGIVSVGGAVGSGGMASTGGATSSEDGSVSAGGVVGAGGAPTTGGTTMAPSNPDVPAAIPDAAPAVTLVWSDEFDGQATSRADATRWTYVTWSAGRMNNEKQQYTSRTANAFLDGDGNLVIRALRPEGSQYTSARLDSKGKFSFRTGRVEVRAKLPSGQGSAPGIALVGTTGAWPDCGELALMEQGGQDKSWFYSTAYAGGASGDTGQVRYDFPNATTASADFHVYSLDWYADGLVFQVDGNNVASTAYDSTSPFASIPESVVLYVAVGGDLGGSVAGKAFPMDMVVDYVRVYAY